MKLNSINIPKYDFFLDGIYAVYRNTNGENLLN